MKRIMLIYGLISGGIIIGITIATFTIFGMEEHSEWLGYLIMIAALSMIFFGIKSYRDGELGGVIKFMTALKVGLGISLVASIVYVGAWETYLQVSDTDFMDSYATSYIQNLKDEGATPAEIDEAEQLMEQYKEMYQNTFMRLAMTFMEIFPVAVIITLISAALLRKPSVLPAGEVSGEPSA